MIHKPSFDLCNPELFSHAENQNIQEFPVQSSSPMFPEHFSLNNKIEKSFMILALREKKC